MQIAKMVPKVFGERRLWELDRDCQNAGFVDQVEPVIPVIFAIAADTVMHKQNRCPGIVFAGPGGVQGQRTIREGGVDIGQRTGTRCVDEAGQFDHRKRLTADGATIIASSSA